MMRRLITYLFFVMATLVLTACGGGGGGGDAFTGTAGGTTVSVASLSIEVSDDQMPTDGSSTVTVTVTAKDQNNVGVEGAEITLSANSGLLQVIDNLTDGSGQVQATLTTGGNDSERTITITASSGGRTATGTVQVTEDAGPAAGKIVLQGSSDELSGTGTGAVSLIAIVTDADNVTIPDVEVEFTADSGALQVDQGTTDEAGQALATLTTAGNPENRTIIVTAKTGSLTSTFSVKVVDATSGASVGKLTLLPGDDELLADGSTPVTLTAVVTDINNIVVEGAQVAFTADSGAVQITQGATDETGTATAVLTTGGDPALRTITVTATAGGLTDTATVKVVNALTGPAFESLQLLVGAPQLGSAGDDEVTLTAIAKNASNVVIEGVEVAFSADSGSLQVTQAVTDAAGQATAILNTGGNKANRTINLVASASSLSATNSVQITGTKLIISGEKSVTSGDTTTLTLSLTDSAGRAISGETVSISSALGNTITPKDGGGMVTSASGEVQVVYSADNASGTDTVEASALGATGTLEIDVSADQFTIWFPDENAEIDIDTPSQVVAQWKVSGVAQVGQTINFSTTRGTLSAPSAVTDADGDALLTIQSSTSGPALITAFVTGGPSTSLPVEFVAVTPQKIAVRADITTVGPNDDSLTEVQQSRIVATLRDANDNLVKDKVVRFTIEQDTSGGTLTTATDTTDSVGQASTTFISGAGTTALNGVVIRASYDDGMGGTISETINLTVARKELFVRLGASHLINEANEVNYSKPFSALVTDAAGNPVANANVTVRVVPTHYDRGTRVWDGTFWTAFSSIDGNPTAPNLNCINEDLNRNGILDAGEDINGDGVLTPGNVAAAPTILDAETNEAVVVSGPDGAALFGVLYARDFADWVQVDLIATVGATGSESVDIANFVLPPLATDVNQEDIGPPGAISPFGNDVICASP